MTRKLILEIIVFLTVTLFVYAATSKLLDYQKFRIQIGQSPMLTGLGDSIPWVIIAMEGLVCMLLMVPRFRLIGFFGAFSLMTMFTVYIYAILNHSSFIPCSCGGILEKLGWREHLVFNVVYVFLSGIGIYFEASGHNSWMGDKRYADE